MIEAAVEPRPAHAAALWRGSRPGCQLRVHDSHAAVAAKTTTPASTAQVKVNAVMELGVLRMPLSPEAARMLLRSPREAGKAVAAAMTEMWAA